MSLEETKGMDYPQGIKWTKQRKAVYRLLREAKEPVSVVQLHASLSKEGEDGYAVSTIYRILATFEEKGLVTKETWMGEGTAVYEINLGSHTHYAICLECHKRIPLEHCPFAHLSLDGETGDFTITGHKLELYGYCKNCKENA